MTNWLAPGLNSELFSHYHRCDDVCEVLAKLLVPHHKLVVNVAGKKAVKTRGVTLIDTWTPPVFKGTLVFVMKKAQVLSSAFHTHFYPAGPHY